MPVDRELRDQRFAVDTVAEPLDQKLPQCGELIRSDGKARGHCVTAAIDQQPSLAGRNHRGTEEAARGTERPETPPVPPQTATMQAGRS